MKSGIAKTRVRPRRRVRARASIVVAATLVLGAFAALPASARLPLDLELSPLPPLPLPLPTPSGELPVAGTVNTVTGVVNGVTGQLDGSIGGGPGHVPAPKPRVVPPSRVDSWSLERLPALQGPGAAAQTAVGSTQLGRPGSYTSLVGGGLRAAAGRAKGLAGPLAAPIVFALFALALLVIAARGPGRLVKIEEERQAFRDRRSYRL